MKNVGIVYDPIYAEHYTGNHPECAERVVETIKVLKKNNMYGENRDSHFEEITPYKASLDQISWIHNDCVVQVVQKKTAQIEGTGSYTYIDGDTVVSEDTYNASLMATGGNLAALDAIMDGEIDRAFILCRPPGHHANYSRSSGFCIFNNIALDVEYLIREKGLKRVAIVDFDVHAGNGTESIFESGVNNGDVLIFSLHQHPSTLYPGTCYPEDIGSGEHRGKTCNVTLFPRAGAEDVKYSFNQLIIPMLNEFKPEFILISAGFDGHHSDRIASLNYDYQLYHWMTERVAELSDKYSKGRILATLEGGYSIDALSKSVTNVCSALRGEKPIYMEDERHNDRSLEFTKDKLIPALNEIMADYWESISFK